MPGVLARGVRDHLVLVLAALAAALAAALLAAHGGQPPAFPPVMDGGEAGAERAYGELPLGFEPNAGRGDPRIDFVARSTGGTTYLSGSGATLALGEGKQRAAVTLALVGAARAEPAGLERLPGVVNDLRGDDPSRWRTGIPTFERVRYSGVYPGVDLDWYGKQRRLEYDFRLAPGADPAAIALRVQGADRLRLARNGDLVVEAGHNTVRQRAPVAYQPAAAAGGAREPVRARFARHGNLIGFRLGGYDRDRPLVIDPLVLTYSTYLGGDAGDVGHGIAVDSTGAAYVTGETSSINFDTVGEIEADSAVTDAFVAKLTPTGDALSYSTYLGGGGSDIGHGIAVDSSGAAYVTGETSSTDFNTVGEVEGDQGSTDAFVAKLTPTGNALSYSTYLGGASADRAYAVALDSAGAAYVTGETSSTDFDTVGEIEGDSAVTDVFVAKLTPAGSALNYSTYLGGDGHDFGYAIAVDAAGAAHVTGITGSTDFNTVAEIEGNAAANDAFVSKLTPAGSALTYSTYLGGADSEEGEGIAVDSSGAAYVTGWTSSTDFNTLGGIEGDEAVHDAFVAKLTPAGALSYSTYLGGDSSDFAYAIAVDGTGAAYVTGETTSSDFNTVGEIEADPPAYDVFVSKLTPAGSALTYSTYLGGASDDVGRGIAVDCTGAAYVTGVTESIDFDTVGDIEDDEGADDLFVSKLTFTDDADRDCDGVVDSADNCSPTANLGQEDSDGDGSGDACDADDDNDGVPDGSDACPAVAGTGADGCPASGEGDGDGEGVPDGVPDGDGEGDGDGGEVLAAFGERTLVKLRAAARRIRAQGPLRVRVINANGFEVTGKLSGRTVKKVAVARKRRIKLKPKAFRVAADAKKTVKLRLPKPLRRELRRKGKLKLRLAAKPRDPAGNTRTVKKRTAVKLRR